MQPDGAIDNKEEVKSDEDLPAYCDPPNPCPIGVVSDDCDPRSYEIFTAQYSKDYQEQQNCMCDDDHNECHKRSKNGTPADRVSELITNLNVRQDILFFNLLLYISFYFIYFNFLFKLTPYI